MIFLYKCKKFPTIYLKIKFKKLQKKSFLVFSLTLSVCFYWRERCFEVPYLIESGSYTDSAITTH